MGEEETAERAERGRRAAGGRWMVGGSQRGGKEEAAGRRVGEGETAEGVGESWRKAVARPVEGLAQCGFGEEKKAEEGAQRRVKWRERRQHPLQLGWHCGRQLGRGAGGWLRVRQ